MKRILFAGGGTGGHVYPAIAIADAVCRLDPHAVIEFAGTTDHIEWDVVPKAGYAIHPITVSGFQRSLSPRNLTFPFKLLKGLWDSFTLVGAFDPDVVVGTGGYVSGPVLAMGKARGRKLVLQEQNAYPGATNRLMGPRADQIHIAFDAVTKHLPPEKCTLSGNPVRAELADVDRAEARRSFGFPEGDDARVLLVFGGSLGSGAINAAMQAHLSRLLEDETLHIIWQAGARYYDALSAEVEEHPRLRLQKYIDRMDLAYAAADLALCRAGAITCSELLVTGLPSILVPSPNVVADHQTKNAEAMADGGAALLLPESALDANLSDRVRATLADADALARMHTAALAMARPAAAEEIARAILDLAGQQ